MKNYTVEKIKAIYNNLSSNTMPLSLNGELALSIEVDKESSIEYIDILFATYKRQPEGVLRIRVDIEGKSINFGVNLLEIKDNAPLRLSFDEKPFVKKNLMLYFEIKYTPGHGPLALWMNTKGPCIKIAAKVKDEISAENRPLISVLVPIYKPALKHLRETVKSVMSQVYDNWELCLVDDGSNDMSIGSYLMKIDNDSRIKVKINTENQGISKTSAEALKMATGEYVSFLDHDDLLEPEALLEVVKALNENPTAKLIYTDEDKIQDKDTFVQPFYKPDWSLEMLLSQSYICHLATYKKSAIENVGGFTGLYEGSQDYGMALRVTETIDEKDIVHIPKILYHWRIVEGSAAGNINSKPYAHVSALKAISRRINSKNKGCVYSDIFPGTYRVNYLNTGNRRIQIIIPTKNNYSYLESCLFSIRQSQYPNYHITVIDNDNLDWIRDSLKTMADASDSLINVVRYDKPFNFSDMNNSAVDNTCDLLLFLNDDTEVLTPDWLEQLSQHIGKNGVVASGAKLLYRDGTIQHAGVVIGIGGVAGHSHKHMNNGNPGYFSRPHITQNVSAVTGACMMVERKAFQEVGGFETALPKAFNDVDLCLKLRQKGHKIVYNPHAVLYHYESISRGLDNHKDPEFAKAVRYMLDKWDCANYNDPYYNPNLTLQHEDFSIG